jgi:hypothetical protein
MKMEKHGTPKHISSILRETFLGFSLLTFFVWGKVHMDVHLPNPTGNKSQVVSLLLTIPILLEGACFLI